ncbi:hypothetical protein U732_2159 [Clostridium argentinense CDC 2741]|uniref:Uncharacterized protein n=1 Tax=Clostridium argentinense CDC 2741 TaxID=1418104 RepID=A0A0C1U2C0_9CLOT|nr:hypothetical protein [Clostridium argentinense]HAG42468.1 hypothetical protein [Clostridium sp.]ARC83597.1 hypothetical protein RSJ17_03095 [Clostridium argentinense]KIE45678.1 hypothetical protein U732_2159 [Clostridium argentinense CDC 2741]NFF40518.1 hypothetical protein [Clostridium argentinense]NFP50836.1 hypothetical protein [Clostridium argentinense]
MSSNQMFIELNYENGEELPLEISFKNDVYNNKYILCRGILNKKNSKIIFKMRNIDETNEFLQKNKMISKFKC